MDEKFWNEEVERLSRTGPGLQTVIQEILAGRLPFRVTGLQGSAPAYFLHQTWTRVRRPMLVVCADPEEAQNLFKDLLFFAGRDPEEIQFFLPSPILYFPVYETPDFREYVPQSDTVAQRLACLYSLLTRPGPVLLITSIQALHSAVMPRELLSSQVDYLVRKEETAREDLLAQLSPVGLFKDPAGRRGRGHECPRRDPGYIPSSPQPSGPDRIFRGPGRFHSGIQSCHPAVGPGPGGVGPSAGQRNHLGPGKNAPGRRKAEAGLK